MSFTDFIDGNVKAIIARRWLTREGRVVPEKEAVVLGGAGGASLIDATVLYADLAGSTELVEQLPWEVAAKVMKCFLVAASRLILHNSGAVRSFDGDRVMGIFIGSAKNTSAVRTALQINYAIRNVVVPRLEAAFPKLASGPYRIGHACGVDSSKLSAVRAGLRENNDLIWVGRAANIAAKLSGIRKPPYNSFVTAATYGNLHESAKFTTAGQAMWIPWDDATNPLVYASSFWWKT